MYEIFLEIEKLVDNNFKKNSNSNIKIELHKKIYTFNNKIFKNEYITLNNNSRFIEIDKDKTNFKVEIKYFYKDKLKVKTIALDEKELVNYIENIIIAEAKVINIKDKKKTSKIN